MQTLLNITDVAKQRIRELISSRKKTTLGIRIAITTKGCSGLSYKVEFADKILEKEEKLTIEDLIILIDPKSVLFIIGSTMDYVDNKIQSGFVFQNPNQKGSCGCGESFYV